MPVTYFKVKPESAMYKNFFIENAERKKLKKHISEFMQTILAMASTKSGQRFIRLLS